MLGLVKMMLVSPTGLGLELTLAIQFFFNLVTPVNENETFLQKYEKGGLVLGVRGMKGIKIARRC